ncbi:MAG TPA: hypothetical protein VGP07_25940, partial [Polyangia bacterium]
MTAREGRLRAGLLLALVATCLRIAWALSVPTIPVGDFAMYRESANYLVEFRRFDSGFVYMPGLVLLLAALQTLGGEIVAAKLAGALFGGLAALPLYILTAHLMLPLQPLPAEGERPPTAGRRVRSLPAFAQLFTTSPVALATTALYALWPAGISLASVIGTDVPAGALLLLAFACLFGWGRTRPLLATVTFGAVTGLAAYFRAVALPLAALSAGYWLACRAGARALVLRTALAVAVTLLVLTPWAIRNFRASGELHFTDSHGGITALMGNYPNSEGTYARSLGIMFKQLTGRTFLSEPHSETDGIAYGIARTWITFEPGWTAGMIALRIERLFAQERGLLYWSLYRPGVLPRHTADWFGQNRPAVTGLVDGYYLFLALFVAAGLAFSLAERRWLMFLPVACAVALAATYALFVAEPRYRLTTEMLLFPVAGLGLVRLGASAGRLVMTAARRPSATSFSVVERQGLLLTVAVVAALALTGTAVVEGGRALRDRHRWAATTWSVNGQAQQALWRGVGGGVSAVRGTAGGAEVSLAAGQSEADAEVILPDLVGAPEPGELAWEATLAWRGDGDPNVRLLLGPGVIPSGADHPHAVIVPSGSSPARFILRL